MTSSTARVRNSVANMRSFLTLPRADELGGSADLRPRSTSIYAVTFPGSLPQICGLCFPCGPRLLFNGPPQPLAERNQGMPVTQSERNFAGLLIHSGVGIRFV